MKKLMLSLFIAFGFSACTLSDTPKIDCGPETDLAFEGFPLLCNYSIKTAPSLPASILISSQERMDQYLTKHENTCPNPSDPKIDFTKNYLVGIFSGLKTTSGYAIKITSIVENKCEILINFYEKGPLPGEPITQTANYPSDFILIPKTGKAILFNKTTESTDNIVLGSFSDQCTGADCQKFYQLNEFNVLKFLNVAKGGYDNFEQYKYAATTKRSEYTTFLKNVPTEILQLKGQTKTYGTPNTSEQGGVYFELRQGAIKTRVFIDNNDTTDQSAEVKQFKKEIQAEITSLK